MRQRSELHMARFYLQPTGNFSFLHKGKKRRSSEAVGND